MKYYALIMIFPVLLLSACSTTSDPREGGFIGGVQNLSSGEYERRLSERQERLDRMKMEQTELDNKSHSLTQNKLSLEKKIQIEKDHIYKLQKDSQLLQKRITQMNSDNNKDENEVNTLRQRVNRLSQNITYTSNSLDALEGDSSGASSVDRQRSQLEAQRKELQNEYQLLLDMTLELGQ